VLNHIAEAEAGLLPVGDLPRVIDDQDGLAFGAELVEDAADLLLARVVTGQEPDPVAGEPG